ncbi:hypothetical protein LSE82_000043 [Salmonella enterica]|nr:hypothetical protein [Salmonella enterica]
MNFLPMKINQKATLLNFFCLQGLTLPRLLAYRYSAPYKTGAGFSSLFDLAGSRLISDMRFFCARYTTLSRIMAGCSGEALRPAGIQVTSLLTPLRLATTFSSVMARLHKPDLEAANMANSPLSAVDPESSQLNQWLQETEIRLLDRVKEALDEAGVNWIDPRTRVRSQPAAADIVEGSDNA